MGENSECILKQICCTCLSTNRKLFKLSRIKDGVNNFYFLLSNDSEAYKEGFFSNPASLHVCWECNAWMQKLIRFRERACSAQKQLSLITEDKKDIAQIRPLTCLSTKIKMGYDKTYVSLISNLLDNFIDCDAVEIKTEDDTDDVPLSQLRNDSYEKSEYSCIKQEDTRTFEDISTTDLQDNIYEPEHDYNEPPPSIHIPKKVKLKKKAPSMTKKTMKKSLQCKINIIDDKELNEIRTLRRLNPSFADALFKCKSCLIGFKSQIDFEEHNLSFHCEKPDHTQCAICLCYIINTALSDHKSSHYLQYLCESCEYSSNELDDIHKHCNIMHKKKIIRKSQMNTANDPDSKSRQKHSMRYKLTPYGFLCNECPKYFESKNLRWKHIQRVHREGFRCHTCAKRFAFRTNLIRHERIHEAPIPREECPVCHKMVRTDLAKVHAAIHTDRQSYKCITCDKTFVSRASYMSHLKYATSHVNTPTYKYKCSVCDKGYRSKGELTDHENYQHKGHTKHQCPVCGKALATRRCIRRHVKRAHEGIKENARDKICQQCGKAFRDKKGLREHEYIHSGERPLSCELCGCTFRQSASLYTHRRRVHNIHASRKEVRLLKG